MLGSRAGAAHDSAAADESTTAFGALAETERPDLHPWRLLPTSTFWGFAIALLAVIFIAVISFLSLDSRSDSQKRMRHTLDVLQHVELLGSALKDAETGQRGYLLTGDSSYLAPYEAAHARIASELARIRPLVADNPDQLARLAGLEQLTTGKLAELAVTIDLAKEGNTAKAFGMVRGGEGKRTMDALRAAIEQIKEAERNLLQQRTAEWERTALVSTFVSLGGAALLLTLILYAASTISREYRARRVQSWLRAGQSGLAVAVMGEQRLDEVAQKVLAFLAGYLQAQVGAFYTTEIDGSLTRRATFAFSSDSIAARGSLRPGEGLLGQASTARQVIELTDVPADYLKVSSALGERTSLSALIVPTSAERTVNAVIELGFFRALLPSDREYLQLVSEFIGGVVRTAQYRSRLEELLEETQRQAEELQSQQEELRVSNEELEEQSRVLQESQLRLENQQGELEQINIQLEEQAQLVESQKDELVRSQSTLHEKNTDLERANQYKTDFLANMSHELRTPLNSSLILAKLLSENRPGNLTPEQIKFANTIYSAGNDLLTLINDVLDLSKIEAGKVDLEIVEVGLAALAASLERQFQPIADDRQLRFVIELDASAPAEIVTDHQRLEQILKNLLSNAFKFTEHGEVVLRVAMTAGDRVAIAVRDTGIGIARHQQEAIFEAFRQADSTTVRKYGGTGLGLSICRDLAALLGGEIEVDSEPGRGSTFTLRLPRRAPASVVPRATPSRAEHALRGPGNWERASGTPAQPSGLRPPSTSSNSSSSAQSAEANTPRRILIIEDDPRFSDILSSLASELAFECLVAHTAEAGLQLASTTVPSAIVLDIRLPDHTGLFVLDRLKRDPATRHIPVHVISAVDYAQSALEMGAVGYMLKPVQREELVSALRLLADKAAQKVRRVLVVEDDAVQRDSVRTLLSADDVETAGAESAKDALAQLRQVTFDCMVLDLALPDSSGFELLEAMAREDQYAFPPVIVYTGRSLSRDEEDRLRLYSRSIIIKGAKSPERLLDEVTLFLHQVESRLPPERRRMLQDARDREALFEGRRILVVEDDVRNIFALSHVLEPKGAAIDIARNGREALERLALSPPVDLILMDIMMPEMDGITAMREIRKQPQWQKLPIIALTAKAMARDHERCLEAGASDYVSKPIDIDKLLSLIRVWMPK